MKIQKFLFGIMFIFSLISSVKAEVALITALDGKAVIVTNDGTLPLEPFIKIKEGDIINLLDKKSYLQITYFENGRQESWNGTGKISITATESHTTDNLELQIKQIPLVIVKRLARTPSLDSQGRAGVTRLRALPEPDEIANIEKTYQELHAKAPRGDLSPELYFLSAMFDMRQFDRMEPVINQLKQNHRSSHAKILVSLYERSINNAKMAEK